MLDVERFIAKYPEIERVSWYGTRGGALLSLERRRRDREPRRRARCGDDRGARGARRHRPAVLADAERIAGTALSTVGPDLDGDRSPTTRCSAPTPQPRRLRCELLGFVSVDLDFSAYERRALAAACRRERRAVAACSAVSWACGRWFLKSALAPLSELEHSLAQLAADEPAVALSELAVHRAAHHRHGARGYDAALCKNASAGCCTSRITIS